MATKTDITVANTILSQIGQKALVMIGAWSLAAGSNQVSFRIGQNSKKIKAIRITLNGSDLYDLEFFTQKGRPTFEVATVAKVEDIYAEDLCSVIESETGMRTSL